MSETILPRRSRWISLSPETWRSDLLRIVLGVLSVLGGIICVPSIFFALKFGMMKVVALDIAALSAILALTYFKRMPAKVRAACTSAVMYGVGAGLMVWVGSVSQIYLFGFSLLATLLLGFGWGLATVALNALTMLAIGFAGIASREMSVPRWTADFAGWSVITANFLFMNTMLVVALGAVIGALESERKALIRLNESLAQNKALLQIAGRTARIGGWQLNVGGTRVQWSDEVCELHDMPVGTMPTLDEAITFYAPEWREKIGNAVARCTSHGSSFDMEAEIVTAKGTRLWIRAIGNAAPNAEGAIAGVHGSVQDITPQKHAEARHDKLEVQLRQAQKMDAVGRLAGGVAHDFNNMLSVILMNTRLTLDSLEAGDARREDLQQVLDAGNRSADLTRQLLAFAREQPIAPKIIDLNETIGNMLKILGRLIGEDIDLVWKADPTPRQIKMDSTQVDQILANLAVNARDAIAGVGKVVIETRSASFDQADCESHPGASPGTYVQISVSDSGCGMDQATQAKLFEPFFTTKAVGAGTGLGLATVYGIVKQNGGFINLYSELGHGSTFRIYLPQVADAMERAPTAAVVVVAKGTETVLLLEDEEALLKLVKRLLERLGYTVIVASTPHEAIALAAQHPMIDLLITDVIMPQMTGRDVWQTISQARPDLKCLFMSGYAADVISHRGVLEAGVHFLQKPFTQEALAEKVRETLNAIA
jgi:signal transduction histidine kinase